MLNYSFSDGIVLEQNEVDPHILSLLFRPLELPKSLGPSWIEPVW